MEIGLFQLENLVLTRAQFLFLDLRAVAEAQPNPTLQATLTAAVHVLPEQVETYLTSAKVAKEFPVILLCKDGRVSHTAAQRLESLGYGNIYVVRGGTEGLLSEP